jgi:hypothetical protein
MLEYTGAYPETIIPNNGGLIMTLLFSKKAEMNMEYKGSFSLQT